MLADNVAGGRPPGGGGAAWGGGGPPHVVRQHPADVLEVPTDEEGVLLNINDPAAYEKILQKSPPG